jgi:hypothetical protein
MAAVIATAPTIASVAAAPASAAPAIAARVAIVAA